MEGVLCNATILGARLHQKRYIKSRSIRREEREKIENKLHHCTLTSLRNENYETLTARQRDAGTHGNVPNEDVYRKLGSEHKPFWRFST